MRAFARNTNRAIGVGLAAVLCATSTTVSAQQSGREPARAGGEVITIDACTIAPLDQLNFLVAANLVRLAQPAAGRSGNRVAVRSLTTDGAACAPFRTALQARLTLLTTSSGTTDSAGATVRFTAEWAAQARFHDSGRVRSSSTLDAATLCVRDVDITRAEPRFGTQVDRGRLRSVLVEELRNQCLEITSLVYVFLERGGTLAPR